MRDSGSGIWYSRILLHFCRPLIQKILPKSTHNLNFLLSCSNAGTCVHKHMLRYTQSFNGLAGCPLDFPSPSCILTGQAQTLHILYDTAQVTWLGLRSSAAWRCSTFIKWTEWSLAMTLWSWWQHYKHCHGNYYYYYDNSPPNLPWKTPPLPSTYSVIRHLTQLASSLRSTHPSRLNLPFLITKLSSVPVAIYTHTHSFRCSFKGPFPGQPRHAFPTHTYMQNIQAHIS